MARIKRPNLGFKGQVGSTDKDTKVKTDFTGYNALVSIFFHKKS